ncbi:MAG: hypothetical protein WCW17_02690 [Patescibacteria group bacterium]
MNTEKKIQELLAKANTTKNKLDLSSDEDLSIAIMNLISIEEHFFFTGAKTENSEYFKLLNETRSIRKDLLKKIVKDPEGEVWCISKHLLAASMRLMEVGTKAYDRGNKDDAKEYFEKAYNLYSLFWGLNMNVIDTKNIKKIDDNQINKNDKEKTGLMKKLGTLVKKTVDCCLE